MGLRQEISVAKSDAELVDLLNKGKTYQFASNRTKNSWKNTAKRVLESINKPTVVVDSKQKDKTTK